MKMKGWYRDNYRHSLAARGIKRYSFYTNATISPESFIGIKTAAALKYRAMNEGLSSQEAERRVIGVYPDVEDDLRTIWDAVEMSRVKADSEDLQSYARQAMRDVANKEPQELKKEEKYPNIIFQQPEFIPPIMPDRYEVAAERQRMEDLRKLDMEILLRSRDAAEQEKKIMQAQELLDRNLDRFR
jgi:hypothetical protein